MARLFKVLARGGSRASGASLKLPVVLDENGKKAKAPSSVASTETAQSAPGVGTGGGLLLNRMLSRQRSSLSEPSLLTVTEQEVTSSPDRGEDSLREVRIDGNCAKWEEESRVGEPPSPSSDTSIILNKAAEFPGFVPELCVDSAWVGEAGSGSALGTPRFVPAGVCLKEEEPAAGDDARAGDVELPLALQDDGLTVPDCSDVVVDVSRNTVADVIVVAPRAEHGVEAELTGKLARVRDWVYETTEQEASGGWEGVEDGVEDAVVFLELAATDVAHSPTLGLSTSFEGVEKLREDGRGRVGVDLNDVEALACWARSIDRMAVGVNLTGYQLKMVPPLASFHHLKTLNLAHNKIARIHPGMLPKSLHRLDLSHNELAVVEGFRELTRLKVLDLSHNHISRVGHGLASCASIRELYISDNEVTVVDGLHRLPKLTALDLSRNRLTSTKALGALAANSVSLRSLNLAGNPIHKNLGEDAFRRYVLGLLPNLSSLNMVAIKRSTRDADSTGKNAKLGRELSVHKSPSKRLSGSGVTNSAVNGAGRKVTRTTSSRVDKDRGSRSARGSLPSEERLRQRVVAREALAPAVGI